MTTQHTPTPWHGGAWDGRAWTVTDERSTHAAFPVIFGCFGNRVANIDSHEDEDCDANAAFIVLACNAFDALVAAAIEALGRLVDEGNDCSDSLPHQPGGCTLCMLRAAIAQAEPRKASQ